MGVQGGAEWFPTPNIWPAMPSHLPCCAGVGCCRFHIDHGLMGCVRAGLRSRLDLLLGVHLQEVVCWVVTLGR